MKGIIIYSTKHGSVEKCAEILKSKLNTDVILVNVKKENVPNLDNFDTVMIGGSIYMGKIQKEISEFCLENLNKLKDKKIGLFTCCMRNGELAEEQLNNTFPQELVSSAVAKKYFGGEFRFKKMNFLEKFIVKMVTKSDNNLSKLDTSKDMSMIVEENISRFAQLMI